MKFLEKCIELTKEELRKINGGGYRIEVSQRDTGQDMGSGYMQYLTQIQQTNASIETSEQNNTTPNPAPQPQPSNTSVTTTTEQTTQDSGSTNAETPQQNTPTPTISFNPFNPVIPNFGPEPEEETDPSYSWGQIITPEVRAARMQDYANSIKNTINSKYTGLFDEKGIAITAEDSSMNGDGNYFRLVGCKMEGTSKIASEITGKNISIFDVNNTFDANKDGLMTREEIEAGIKKNLPEGKTLTTDYFEKTLNIDTFADISNMDGVTYILARAEKVHGGQHWIVVEGVSKNEYGQYEFSYNGTSANDAGRRYILGEPIAGQEDFYRVSKIELFNVQ